MDTYAISLHDLSLICGMVGALVYFGSDRWLGSRIKAYSFSAQSMSDISAVGSPERMAAVILAYIACGLMTVFGLGVWLATDLAGPVRVIGALIVMNAWLSLVATRFFPASYGVRPPFRSPGVLLMFGAVLAFVAAILVGALAVRGWFQYLSLGIVAAYVVLAAVRFSTTRRATAEQAASLIGTQERTMAYTYLAWVFAFSLLLR